MFFFCFFLFFFLRCYQKVGGGIFFGRYVTLWVLWIGAKRLVFFFFGFVRFVCAAYTYLNVLRFSLARGRFFLGILCIWGVVCLGGIASWVMVRSRGIRAHLGSKK